MRLALIVDAYAPARTSAAVQVHDLAHELAAQGHAPTVITPSPELDAPWSLAADGGVEVLRTRAPRTKDIGHVRRGLAELALPFAMLRGLARSPLAATRWDGVAWYSPAIFLGPLVHALARRSGCRAYLILRDLFPDWAVDAGVMRRGAAYHALKLVERYQYSVADVIGVQAAGNLRYLAAWARGPRRRLEVLDNWLADAPVGPCSLDVAATPLAGKTVFVYAGNMGAAQGVDAILELATRLPEVGFLFVGRGSDVARLRGIASERALANVVFHDEVEPWEVPGLLAQCDVGVVALDPRHRSHNIPGKLLTYLRAGLPVLARINPGNDLEAIVHDAGAGLCAGASLDDLEQRARQLLADPAARRAMGQRGRALADARFSARAAAAQLVAGLQPRASSSTSQGLSARTSTG